MNDEGKSLKESITEAQEMQKKIIKLKNEKRDLKFELRQLRLRLDGNEMKIKKLENDLANTKKNLLNIMMANEIALQVLNQIVDDVKVLKEAK